MSVLCYTTQNFLHMLAPLTDCERPQLHQDRELPEQRKETMSRAIAQKHAFDGSPIWSGREAKRIHRGDEAGPFKLIGSATEPFQSFLKVPAQAPLRLCRRHPQNLRPGDAL